MADKNDDGTVAPIRGRRSVRKAAPSPAPITAAELRKARDGLLAAEGTALDALTRILAECEKAPPGTSALMSTYALDPERGALTRSLLEHLGPSLHVALRGA
jgi:hypothetical protein